MVLVFPPDIGIDLGNVTWYCFCYYFYLVLVLALVLPPGICIDIGIATWCLNWHFHYHLVFVLALVLVLLPHMVLVLVQSLLPPGIGKAPGIVSTGTPDIGIGRSLLPHLVLAHQVLAPGIVNTGTLGIGNDKSLLGHLILVLASHYCRTWYWYWQVITTGTPGIITTHGIVISGTPDIGIGQTRYRYWYSHYWHT